MTDLNKLDGVFEKIEAPDIKLLREIGKRIGFGRACQILGKQWDDILEKEWGLPRGRGKMERRNDIEAIEAVIAARAASQTCVAKPELPVKTWRERAEETEFDSLTAADCLALADKEIKELRAAISANGQTAQAAMPSPFEDSTRIEDLIHANQNMHLAMQEQSELVCSLTRELNETKLRASFAALPVGKRVLVDSAPQPSHVSEQDKLKDIATKLRRAGADIPAPHHDDAIKGATINGLSIALLLVDEALGSQPKPE